MKSIRPIAHIPGISRVSKRFLGLFVLVMGLLSALVAAPPAFAGGTPNCTASNVGVASYLNLDNCNFSNWGTPGQPQFPGGNFSHDQLVGANFSNMYPGEIVGLDFSYANLTSAILPNQVAVYTNFTGATLLGADLAGDLFAGQNSLRGDDLQSADLNGANFDDYAGEYLAANLDGANLAWTSDIGTDFSHAVISPAQSLYAADLTNADFTDATLDGSNLQYANLSGANLTNLVFQGVPNQNVLNHVSSGGTYGTPDSMPTNWQLNCGYVVGPGADLVRAILSNCNLDGADLNGADMASASIDNTNLTDAQLVKASLAGATLTGVNLTNANSAQSSFSRVDGLGGNDTLTGGHFTSSDFTGAEFMGATITNVAFNKSNFTNAVITGSNLTGADFANGILTCIQSGGDTVVNHMVTWPTTKWFFRNGYIIGPGACLTGAALNGADLTGANLTGTNLTDSDLSGATLTAVIWSNTTCPDGTNSNSDGGTCVNHLSGIISVAFEGSAADPTVVIDGYGLGSEPTGFAASPGCGGTGQDFNNNDLYLQDTATTQNWSAGMSSSPPSGDFSCIGLLVTYSGSQITFSPGSFYNAGFALNQGDTFDVGVYGKTFAGTVWYPTGPQ